MISYKKHDFIDFIGLHGVDFLFYKKCVYKKFLSKYLLIKNVILDIMYIDKNIYEIKFFKFSTKYMYTYKNKKDIYNIQLISNG